MSDILLKKINNILEIDLDASYINSYEYQNEMINLTIDLDEYSPNIEQIRKCWAQNEVTKIIVNPNYQEVLQKLKSIYKFEGLYELLKENNIPIESADGIVIESKKEAATFQSEKEFWFDKKNIYDNTKETLIKEVELFRVLNKRSFKEFIEKGKNILCLTSHYLIGNINEISFNAPIFVRDVEINIEKENEAIITFKSEPYINEKLILTICKELKVKLQFEF